MLPGSLSGGLLQEAKKLYCAAGQQALEIKDLTLNVISFVLEEIRVRIIK